MLNNVRTADKGLWIVMLVMGNVNMDTVWGCSWENVDTGV